MFSVMLSLTRARPQSEDDLQKSISAVLKSLEAEPEPALPVSGRYHPQIITKYDFLQTRNKKSHLELPAEFVVSTNLNVNAKQNHNHQVICKTMNCSTFLSHSPRLKTLGQVDQTKSSLQAGNSTPIERQMM